MARRRVPVTGEVGLHSWADRPDRRRMNDGLGCCNTGSGSLFVCALGGIGCDVDHIAIARAHLRELDLPPVPSKPSDPVSEGGA